MKRLILAFSTTLLASIAWAEGLMFKDASELVGTWTLESTALTRESERKTENATWDFQSGGKVVVTSFYSFAPTLTGEGKSATIEDQYQIKDGKLVTTLGGQYELVERQGDQMILKGSDGFYFFKKK
jgi:hypothetical protein